MEEELLRIHPWMAGGGVDAPTAFGQWKLAHSAGLCWRKCGSMSGEERESKRSEKTRPTARGDEEKRWLWSLSEVNVRFRIPFLPVTLPVLEDEVR